jgi:hypothetical protein
LDTDLDYVPYVETEKRRFPRKSKTEKQETVKI